MNAVAKRPDPPALGWLVRVIAEGLLKLAVLNKPGMPVGKAQDGAGNQVNAMDLAAEVWFRAIVAGSRVLEPEDAPRLAKGFDILALRKFWPQPGELLNVMPERPAPVHEPLTVEQIRARSEVLRPKPLPAPNLSPKQPAPKHIPANERFRRLRSIVNGVAE